MTSHWQTEDAEYLAKTIGKPFPIWNFSTSTGDQENNLLTSKQRVYCNMMLAWPGSERKLSDDFISFCGDQKINCIKLL